MEPTESTNQLEEQHQKPHGRSTDDNNLEEQLLGGTLQLQLQDSHLSPALCLLPSSSGVQHTTEYSLFQQSDLEFAPLRASPDISAASERLHFPPVDHTVPELSQHPLSQASISCCSLSQHSIFPGDVSGGQAPGPEPAGPRDKLVDHPSFLSGRVPAQRPLERLREEAGMASSSDSALSSERSQRSARLLSDLSNVTVGSRHTQPDHSSQVLRRELLRKAGRREGGGREPEWEDGASAADTILGGPLGTSHSAAAGSSVERDLWSSGNQAGVDGSYLGFLPQSQSTPGVFSAPPQSAAKVQRLSAIQSGMETSGQSLSDPDSHHPGPVTPWQQSSASEGVHALPCLNYMEKVDAWRANQSPGQPCVSASMAVQANKEAAPHMPSLQRAPSPGQAGTLSPSPPGRGEASGSAPNEKEELSSTVGPLMSPLGRSQSHSSLITVVTAVTVPQRGNQDSSRTPQRPPLVSLGRFSDVSLDGLSGTLSSSQDCSVSGKELGASLGASSVTSLEVDNYAPYWNAKATSPPPRPPDLNIEERIPLYLLNLGIDQSPSTILTPFGPRGPIREPEFSPTDFCTIKGSIGTPTKSTQLSEVGTPHKGEFSRCSLLSVDSSMSLGLSADSLCPAVSLLEQSSLSPSPDATPGFQGAPRHEPQDPHYTAVSEPDQLGHWWDSNDSSSQSTLQHPSSPLKAQASCGEAQARCGEADSSTEQIPEASFTGTRTLQQFCNLLSQGGHSVSSASHQRAAPPASGPEPAVAGALMTSQAVGRAEPEGCSAAPPDTTGSALSPPASPAPSGGHTHKGLEKEEKEGEEEQQQEEAESTSSEQSMSGGSCQSSLSARVARLLQSESSSSTMVSSTASSSSQQQQARDWAQLKVCAHQPAALDVEDRKEIEKIKRDLQPIKAQASTDSESSALSSVGAAAERQPAPSNAFLEEYVHHIAAREGVSLPRAQRSRSPTSITIATCRRSPSPPLSPLVEPLHLDHLEAPAATPQPRPQPTATPRWDVAEDQVGPPPASLGAWQIDIVGGEGKATATAPLPAPLPTSLQAPLQAPLPLSLPAPLPTSLQAPFQAPLPVSLPVSLPAPLPASLQAPLPAPLPVSLQDPFQAPLPVSLPVFLPAPLPASLQAHFQAPLPVSLPASLPASLQAPLQAPLQPHLPAPGHGHVSHLHLTLAPRATEAGLPSGARPRPTPAGLGPPARGYSPIQHSSSSPDEGLGLSSPPDDTEPLRTRGPEGSRAVAPEDREPLRTRGPEGSRAIAPEDRETLRTRGPEGSQAVASEDREPLRTRGPEGSQAVASEDRTAVAFPNTVVSCQRHAAATSPSVVHRPTVPALLPYKPHGSEELFYMPHTESQESPCSSDTTMESSHPGSDDAVPPCFSSEVLGRQDPGLDRGVTFIHTEGIYSKRLKTTSCQMQLGHHRSVVSGERSQPGGAPPPSSAAPGCSRRDQGTSPVELPHQEDQGSESPLGRRRGYSRQSDGSLDQLWRRFNERRGLEESRPTHQREVSLMERLERLERLIRSTAGPRQRCDTIEEEWRRKREELCVEDRDVARETRAWAQEDLEGQASLSSSSSSSQSQHLCPAERDQSEATSSGSISSVDTARLVRAFGAHRVKGSSVRLCSGLEQHQDPPREPTASESTATHHSIVDSTSSMATTVSLSCSHHAPQLQANKKAVKLNKSIQAGDLEIVSNGTRRHTRDVGTTFPSPGEARGPRQISSPAERGRVGSLKERRSSRGQAKCYPQGVFWFVPAEELRAEARKENTRGGEGQAGRRPASAWFEAYRRASAWREPLRQRHMQEGPNHSLLHCEAEPAPTHKAAAAATAACSLVRVSLQEALAMRRPEFVCQSRERMERLAVQAEQRKHQAALSRERALFSIQHGGLQQLPRPTGAALLRRAVSRKEMVQRSKQTYEKLPEVQRRREEERRNAEYRSYRLNAQLYNKKITSRVLGRRIAWH